MQFSREKCGKVTFKKGSLVQTKNITLEINTEISEVEHNKYLGINQANGINQTIKKEKYENNSVGA